jgi:hypothetical protein
MRLMDFRIISIGTLAQHPLWGERTPVRTGHATTTLVRSGDRFILSIPRCRRRCWKPAWPSGAT